MTTQHRLSIWQTDARIFLFAAFCGLLTLLPPGIIGTGQSALTLQSVEHWLIGRPDAFAAQHAHWIWIPWLIAKLTGDAFVALTLFKALLLSSTLVFTFKALCTRFDRRRSLWGMLLVAFNVNLLYYAHTFDPSVLGLCVCACILWLRTSGNPSHVKLGFLLLGLSISISLFAFIYLGIAFTIVRSMGVSTFNLRSRDLYVKLGLLCLGVLSWYTLQVLYFGYAGRLEALRTTIYQAQNTSNFVLGALFLLYSLNLFFIPQFKTGVSKRLGLAGAQLIPLLILLFSPPNPQPLLIIILPALSFVALEAMGNLRWFTLIYLVLNLGLFLFLPAWQNAPEVFMPVERRSEAVSGSDWQYYSSTALKGIREIIEKKHGEKESMALLRETRSDSSIIITDGSTNYWFDGATLSASFPERRVGWYFGRPINRILMNGLYDTEYVKPCLTIPRLIGIFDKQYAREYIDSMLPAGVAIRESERLQIVELTTEESRKALVDRLIYLHYHSFH